MRAFDALWGGGHMQGKSRISININLRGSWRLSRPATAGFLSKPILAREVLLGVGPCQENYRRLPHRLLRRVLLLLRTLKGPAEIEIYIAIKPTEGAEKMGRPRDIVEFRF